MLLAKLSVKCKKPPRELNVKKKLPQPELSKKSKKPPSELNVKKKLLPQKSDVITGKQCMNNNGNKKKVNEPKKRRPPKPLPMNEIFWKSHSKVQRVGYQT